MHPQNKKVQKLIKFVCSILLLFIATMGMNKHKYVELHAMMQQVQHTSSVILSEQSAAEKTIAHLYAEGLVTPVSIAGEWLEYHPAPSKSKYHTTHRPNRHGDSASTEAIGTIHHHVPIPNHVIDYYIYTLEHILI